MQAAGQGSRMLAEYSREEHIPVATTETGVGVGMVPQTLHPDGCLEGGENTVTVRCWVAPA